MPSCVLVSIACFVVIERPARNSLSGQGTIPGTINAGAIKYKALGLTIPQSLLLRADQVIE